MKLTKKLKKIDIKRYFIMMSVVSIVMFSQVYGGDLNVFMVAFSCIISGTAMFVAIDLISMSSLNINLIHMFSKKTFGKTKQINRR